MGTQDRRGEMQGLKIGPLWESRMILKAMGLTRDVLMRVGMLVAALNSRQEYVHEEKRSQMRRDVPGFCRYRRGTGFTNTNPPALGEFNVRVP